MHRTSRYRRLPSQLARPLPSAHGDPGLDPFEKRQSGVTGFPTLIVGSEEDGYAAVTRGYQPAERVEALIEGWLAQRDTVAV